MATIYSGMKRKKLKKTIAKLAKVVKASEIKVESAEKSVEAGRKKFDKKVNKLSKKKVGRDIALTALAQASQALADLDGKTSATEAISNDKTKPSAKKRAARDAANGNDQSSKAARSITADDLTIIRGIGPKVATVLNEQGITSWTQLASCKPESLKKLLTDAGLSYRVLNPETWPTQAALAKSGKFDDLKEMQSNSKAGHSED